MIAFQKSLAGWALAAGATAAGAAVSPGAQQSQNDQPQPRQERVEPSAPLSTTPYRVKLIPLAQAAPTGATSFRGQGFGTTQFTPSTPASDFLTAYVNPLDDTLGAVLEPVNAVLREQLGLADDRGLLVRLVDAEGPAGHAGLKANDILLTLDGKPLASADDLTDRLKDAGEKDVPLELLRAGKPQTIQVRPVYRVTLGPAGPEKADYFIGVAINVPEPVLRDHLKIPDGQGLIVTEIVPRSPAAKAGVKSNDILLEFDGKALGSTLETLSKQLAEGKGKTGKLKLLRGGETLTVQVTPEPRKTSTWTSAHGRAVRLWSLNQNQQGLFTGQAGPRTMTPLTLRPTSPAPLANLSRATVAEPLAGRIDQLEGEIKSLRKAIDELSKALKDRPARD